jgi:hypothetical protein
MSSDGAAAAADKPNGRKKHNESNVGDFRQFSATYGGTSETVIKGRQ